MALISTAVGDPSKAGSAEEVRRTSCPETVEGLSAFLADASRMRRKVPSIDLSRMNALIEHKPEDMTATVQSGMRLGEFQKVLRAAGQWLPLDPAGENELTIHQLLALNLSGPRRPGYGTARDYLIGIRVVLAGGEIIRAGGKVVKNVAGYDLCKLFIGAKDSLGIIVEGTFKLRPLPESECLLEKSFSTLDDLARTARAVLNHGLDPIVLDCWRLPKGEFHLTAGFAGAREDVQRQVEQAATLGLTSRGSTEYHELFWRTFPNAVKLSVLPSRCATELQKLGAEPCLSHFANGVIYSPALPTLRSDLPATKYQERVKLAYDPERILPEYQA